MTIKGNQIKNAWTLGSMYDQNSIAIETKQGPCYRIKAEEILKMMQHFDFNTHKKITYTYLINPKLKRSK